MRRSSASGTPHDTSGGTSGGRLRRLARFAGAVAFPALAACDGYPDGWPGMRGGVLGLAVGCPDLTGTYRLSPAREGGRPLSQSLIGRTTENAKRQRWHWETLTIEGRAADSLVLTLRRSPESQLAYRDTMRAWGNAWERERQKLLSPTVRWRTSFGAMDDSAYAENLRKLTIAGRQRQVVVRGRHYECDGGWLVADRLVHDPGPDRDRPRPDTVIGTVAMAVDRGRRLVLHSRFPEALEFALWCGDGCRGIPLGTWTQHEWGRLEPASAPPDLVEPTPWAEPFHPDSVTVVWAVDPLQSPEEIAALLRPAVDGTVTLEQVARVPGHYRARFRSAGGYAAFHPLLERLHAMQSIGTLTVTGVAPGAGGHLLWLDVYVVSRASATEASAIEARMRAVLPRGALLERVRRDGATFHVHLVFPSREAFLAMVNAVRRDPAFQEPDIEVIAPAQVPVRAVFRLREKVAP